MAHFFYLTPIGRQHLAQHFGNGMRAGSYFLQETFQTPEDLIVFLNNVAPDNVFEQTPVTTVFTYTLTDGRMAGTVGIAKRDSVGSENITTEVRDGLVIEVAKLDELALTPEFSIVARRTNQGHSIITGFPGSPARPFARKRQPAPEYALNKLFWEEHILLKLKS
ncbi:MAG: hypothetical protein ACK478_04195 [Flavobacteriales bacterium]|jgi:hypothetical protein